MTEDALREIVRKWQDRLGLGHWRIAVIIKDGVNKGDTPAHAVTHRSVYYDRASIEFDKKLVDGEYNAESIEGDLIRGGMITVGQMLEETVIHELMHIRMRNIMEVGDLVREQLSKPVTDMWDAGWRRAEEELCESMACALRVAFE